MQESFYLSSSTGALTGLAIYNALSGHICLAAICGGIAATNALISIRCAMEEVTTRTKKQPSKTTITSTFSRPNPSP